MKRGLLRTLGFIMTCGIAAIALTSCGKKKTETPKKDGYNILWSDEFDGKKLNDDIWLREIRPAGWTNSELQKYVSDEENGFVRDGKFVIKGIEFENSEYTSCKLRNQSSHAFKYGRVEVSAKVPEGKGLWPAIWMMPKEESYYGQWPKCGEIDIMEVLGSDVSKAYGTLHWGEPHAEKQGTVTLTDGNTYANGFHEFAIEWEPGRIEWFIDGNSYLVVDDWFTAVEGEDEKPFPAPFDQDFCIQINLAIGGTWPGNPDKDAEYMKNAEFEIDYVRVYQKTEGYDESNVKRPEKVFRNPDATGNYITNADFSGQIYSQNTNNLGWVYLNNEQGDGSFEVLDGGIVKISIANEGIQNYSIQFLHTEMVFKTGKTYEISFEIWSDEERMVKEICVDAPEVGWSRYWKVTKLQLTTTAHTEYKYEFTMDKKSDNAARFEFNLGNAGSTAAVYIANVRVAEKTSE